MENLWASFCGDSDCNGATCGFFELLKPSSCVHNCVVVCLDVLLLFVLLSTAVISKPSSAKTVNNASRGYTSLEIVSAVYNGCLGSVYLGLGILQVSKQIGVLPLHRWVVVVFLGFTWLILSLNVSLGGKKLGKGMLRLCSVITCLIAGLLCFSAVLVLVVDKMVSVNIVLGILLLPGAVLLLLCTLKGNHSDDTSEIGDRNSLYAPLNGGSNGHIEADVGSETPFAKAGFLSKMTFWWLNPLMKSGKEKTLNDADIPLLRKVDRAKSCYMLFTDRINSQKQTNASEPPSILWTMFLCYWKEILISGFFALLKILTMSAGPLLLNAFIKVAEGKQTFKYEGYALVVSLFFTKFFIKIRSILSAAIYKKQLRLSNSARMVHSAGEITNYVTVDAYRIGEFPYWFHQTWTTILQLCIALVILFHTVGLATIAALAVIVLNVLCNTPVAKLQHKFQSNLMVAQDERLKAISEALVNMKILKLYAWETHFKSVIERLREEELKWLSAVQLRRAYNAILLWSSPVLVSAATFGACYFLGVPLYASNAFTFLATLRLVQEPVRAIPEVIGVVIQAKVALARITRFLGAQELQTGISKQKDNGDQLRLAISIKLGNFSWEENPLKPTLSSIKLEVKPGEKVAVCGEVGAGKSTMLAAILGEVLNTEGTVQIYGKIAYVSQTAWIQTGTIQDNILFGCNMDRIRYQETLEKCLLLKDLEMLPFGDLTEIGERGVNLSGGQKQRIQLARALYQDADIYLMDDPFSAVDAHTATNLFNEYVMGALSAKTVLLVTHQVDFLPKFDSILLMSDGQILRAAPYHVLLASCQEFSELVNAHKEISSSLSFRTSSKEISKTYGEKQLKSVGHQLIKLEERESGDTGLKPYLQYLNQSKGFIYFSVAILAHIIFVGLQVLQNSWMAANVENPQVTKLRLIVVYLVIGCGTIFLVLVRMIATVSMGLQSSKSLFYQLLNCLFHAPMSFYDSTPLGRILSRVSSDLSIVDLDIPFSIMLSVVVAMGAYANLGVLAVITWPVLFVSVPMIIMAICLQKYYFASAKEFMRINGTTKSMIANHLAESIAGNLDLIDKNSSPFFHIFSANEWLIQRLEILSAVVLSTSALVMVFLPQGTFSSGFVGMALSYGLSLNISLVISIQYQCTLANHIISVERLKQYLHIPSEAQKSLKQSDPYPLGPLLVRYRPNTPLVLQGISCTFEGGHKIGIVGRTGSGKTTMIGALFHLVEPVGGKVVIDSIDISTIGLHDLRSRLGIIPQDPILFNGTVRYNLDPLSQHSDQEIWEVLGKCQLEEAVREKGDGLDSLVADDGSNWSMGQRQLFCLGRALLRRCRILVLDEATASIDNATDSILQKTIRVEFADSTVITVAHRIPTVMDYTMVLALSDGKIMEYDEPMKLMNTEGSLFAKLVKEYWSHSHSADST
ncbi:hypothetical protein MKX03_036854 [Papaver bracteatum]|nr:hypothetical protein MKX03_036854 [Papaver bracteatum]